MSYRWYMNDKMGNNVQTYPLGTYRLIAEAGMKLNVTHKRSSTWVDIFDGTVGAQEGNVSSTWGKVGGGTRKETSWRK